MRAKQIWLAGGSGIGTDLLAEVAAGLRVAGLESASGPRGKAACVVVVGAADAATIELIRNLSEGGTTRLLVVTTASALEGNREWAILKAGASDILAWCRNDNLGRAIAAKVERWDEIERILESPVVNKNIRGRSHIWRAFLRRLIGASLFSDAPLLVTGETGTGKELAARLVHTLTRPKKTDLVVVDCTTIVPELAGSELFGHERGAFTGADRARDGAIALAHGGTLFLDEVGELPLSLQAQLLRAVQERVYKRVGGNTWERAEFRVVSATNRELLDEVRAGRFRSDLYYRLSGEVLRAPSLREHPEDIKDLVEAFMNEARGGDTVELAPGLLRYLESRDYPGNVRDLKRLAFMIAGRHIGVGPVTIGCVPEEEWPVPDVSIRSESARTSTDVDGLRSFARDALAKGLGLRDVARQAEEAMIQVAMKASPTQREAARRLGVTERTLQIRRAHDHARPRTGDNGTPNGEAIRDHSSDRDPG